jgi:hypothetical protein
MIVYFCETAIARHLTAFSIAEKAVSPAYPIATLEYKLMFLGLF